MVKVTDELCVIPGLDEPRSVVASAGEGVRVVIHPPNTQPFPFVEGYDVPPGFSASFSIHPRFIARLGPPYGNCSQASPFETNSEDNSVLQDNPSVTMSINSQPGFEYRLISCQRMCAQSHVIAACNCYDNSLPVLPEMRRQRRTSASKSVSDTDEYVGGHRTVKPCRLNDELADSCMDNDTDDCLEAMLAVYDRIVCSQRTRRVVARNKTLMAQCGCHPPCEEFVYDVSYSLAKWPASGFEGERTYYEIFEAGMFSERFGRTSKERKEFVSNYFNETNRHETMKNFARLNVYIADSNVVVTREAPDFEFSQLVSDIGGQLGVWVGMSVVTLSEVIELIYLLLYHFLASRRRRHSRDPPMTSVESLTSSRTSGFDGVENTKQLSIEHQV